MLGKGRTPASALTCLLKSHHPGLINYRGKSVPASTWKHYQATKDTAGISKADVVEQEFWCMQWGQMVQNQNENFQKFMEDLAAHTGLTSGLVPPPVPPPPPPPTYGVSASPSTSLENVGTFSSAIREESPEDTLHRISSGVFGGPNNVTASGDGNYCPPEDEEFPLSPIHL